jgi:hypothetical protein
MYIRGDYKGCLFGIVFDPATGEVTCSTKSLSTICSNADAGVELDSSELAKMDKACLEFLTQMRYHDKEEHLSERGEKFSNTMFDCCF